MKEKGVRCGAVRAGCMQAAATTLPFTIWFIYLYMKQSKVQLFVNNSPFPFEYS
jgi:hypothetical protein